MNPYPPFPSTQWTRLEREGATAEGQEWFCETYRPAVLAYLRAKYEHHEAEDLCHEFFAKVVLARDLAGRADRRRGSLRGLLRASLDNFLSNHRRESRSKKRGGGAIHQRLSGDARDGLTAATTEMAPDRAFDKAWAANLLERALAATEADCAKRNKQALFAALRPMLDGSGPARPQAEIAHELGLKVREITLALSRLRQRVGKYLYDEVARTVAGTESAAEEWESVRQALEGP